MNVVMSVGSLLRSVIKEALGADAYRASEGAAAKEELFRDLKNAELHESIPYLWLVWKARNTGARQWLLVPPFRGGQRVPAPVARPETLVLPLLSLASTLWDQRAGLYEPATSLVVLANLAVFFSPGGLPGFQVGLSPAHIMERGEGGRLVSAAFVHVDAAHLIGNMGGILPDCLLLERAHGSAGILSEVALMTLVTNGLYVGLAVFQKSIMHSDALYYNCGVGFSGVAFALQVISGHNKEIKACALGEKISWPQFKWAGHLLSSIFFTPESSFAVHACGVAAGLLRMYALGPGARLLGWRQTPHTIVPAAVDGGEGAAAAAEGMQVVVPRRARLSLRALCMQLALLAGNVGAMMLWKRARASMANRPSGSRWAHQH